MKSWKEHIEIILLTLWVAVFRLIHLFDFPLNHDEYSSLIRTDYSSFSDLIQRGVMTDAHPPFLQVFLTYWVRLVGTEAWMVKLPFILFSIAAVPLIYAFVKSWWGKSTALITAAGTGLLFLPAYYGMMARPYASGMFFIALLAFSWTRLVKDKPSMKWAIITGVSFALCAFNHHFTALYAFLMWVSGWFFVHRTNIRYYLISSIVAIALYAFNLPILLAQLGLKGIGSINPMPTPTFVFEHLRYLFNYSVLLVIAFSLLFVAGFFFGKKISKITTHAALWWIMPILIGYVYSIKVDSLLNDRSLMFGIPFFLAAITSGLKTLEVSRTRAVLVSVVIVCSCSTLIERGLYTVNIGSALSELPQHPSNDEIAFVAMSDTIGEFVKKGSTQHWMHVTEDFSFIRMHRLLETADAEKAFFGWGVHRFTPSLDYLGVIREYYPVIEQSNGYVDGEYWVFNKSQARGYDIKNTILGYPYKNNLKVKGDEYPFATEVSLKEEHRNDLILFSVQLEKYENVPDVLAVLVVEHEGIEVNWQGRSAVEMIPDYYKKGFTHTVLRLLDIPYPLDQCKLKILVWNKGKDTFEIKDTQVEYLPGNSKLYKHISH